MSSHARSRSRSVVNSAGSAIPRSNSCRTTPQSTPDPAAIWSATAAATRVCRVFRAWVWRRNSNDNTQVSRMTPTAGGARACNRSPDRNQWFRLAPAVPTAASAVRIPGAPRLHHGVCDVWCQVGRFHLFLFARRWAQDAEERGQLLGRAAEDVDRGLTIVEDLAPDDVFKAGVDTPAAHVLQLEVGVHVERRAL